MPCVRVLVHIASTNVYVLWKFMATCVSWSSFCGHRDRVFQVGIIGLPLTVDELTPPARPQAVLFHQPTDTVTADVQTLSLQRRTQPTAAVVATAGQEGGLQGRAQCAGSRRLLPMAGGIQTRAADTQQPAQTGSAGLLLPLIDQFLDHFSSRAKKADAFFSSDMSSRSRRFSRSNSRMRCCSGVSGLPIPTWPD